LWLRRRCTIYAVAAVTSPRAIKTLARAQKRTALLRVRPPIRRPAMEIEENTRAAISRL
jgi:hypothetical protein